MRLHICPTVAVVAAAALVGGSAPAATAAPTGLRPTGLRPAGLHTTGPHTTGLGSGCTTTDNGRFPVRTAVQGGPSSYEPGGGYGDWSLDLTNTTARTCRNIHPVIVIVDEKRALRAAQLRLRFSIGTRAHPVSFQPTAADELVGVLDHDDFPGFTVLPGRTVTVKLRLAVTSAAAVPNHVVAKAAVVQRRGSDGEWVGESNDYGFRIVERSTGQDGEDGQDGQDGRDDGVEKGREGEDVGEGEAGEGRGKDIGGRDSTGRDAGARSGPDGTDTDLDTGPDSYPDKSIRREGLPFTEELARSGSGVPPYGIGGLLLGATGAVLVAVARRKPR